MTPRAGTTSVDPARARESAEAILSQSRYDEANSVPRPLRGPIEWLADRLRPIGEWVGDVLGTVPGWLWVALAVATLALVLSRIARSTPRRARSAQRSGRAEVATSAADPVALERAADDAERRGDYDDAVRLRFRAGLIRLDEQTPVGTGASTTAGAVRAELRSPRFDALADDFERVAYSDRHATPTESGRAREEWPRVVDEARSP